MMTALLGAGFYLLVGIVTAGICAWLYADLPGETPWPMHLGTVIFWPLALWIIMMNYRAVVRERHRRRL